MPYVSQTPENNYEYVINSHVMEALEEKVSNTVESRSMEYWRTELGSVNNLPSFTIVPLEYSDYFSVYDVDLVRFKEANLVRFKELLSRWHNERGITSSLTKIVLCQSYQEIIGMGPDAILLILRQLKIEGDKPDYWFWALQSLTGENPVPQENIGDFRAMAYAWLRWGRDRYAELASE
jgi:hypothetical protein